MKEGETIICVSAGVHPITENKEYKVIKIPLNEDDNKVVIIDDNGVKATYYKSRFIQE